MSKESLELRLTELVKNYEWKEWPRLPGQTNHIRCGVLVPALLTDDVTVFAGVRSRGLEKHAGEICFPGGRPEEADADLKETALREAREEMGIENATILGRLSSMPLYTSEYRLEPHVGLIHGPAPVADGHELVEIVPISIKAMLARPRIPSLVWNNQGMKALAPVFDLDGRLMFGATAYVLMEVMMICASLFETEMPPLEEGPYTWPQVVAWAKGSAQ